MKFAAVTAALTIALLSASIASAAGPVAWSSQDMKAAVRALGYPKPHPTKLSCRGKTMFRCVATYKHGRRVFYAQWQGLGGWLCAGTRSACKPLRHGFVPTAQETFEGGPAGTAELAARGYIGNHYNIPDPFVSSPCTSTGAMTWACGYYTSDTTKTTVMITLKQVKGGYVVSGSSS